MYLFFSPNHLDINDSATVSTKCLCGWNEAPQPGSTQVWLCVALVKKNPPAKQEIWVRSLGGEDPLEEGMATCSSILAWRIPWTEEPGRLQFIGLQRVEHNWTNLVSTHIGKYQREETCLVNTGSLHGESHSRFVHYRRFAVVVVVQLLSCVRLFVIWWIIAHQSSLSFIISWSLLKLMSVDSVMPSIHLVLCFRKFIFKFQANTTYSSSFTALTLIKSSMVRIYHHLYLKKAC